MSKQKTLLELAEGLDFEQAHEYTNYIIDSLVNGNRKQVKDLYNAINPNEWKTFERDLLSQGGEKYTLEVAQLLGFNKTRIENIFFDNWEPVPHIETELLPPSPAALEEMENEYISYYGLDEDLKEYQDENPGKKLKDFCNQHNGFDRFVNEWNN